MICGLLPEDSLVRMLQNYVDALRNYSNQAPWFITEDHYQRVWALETSIDHNTKGMANSFNMIAETMVKLNEQVTQCISILHQEVMVLRVENQIWRTSMGQPMQREDLIAQFMYDKP